jgi:hypothetical protein
MNEFEIKNNLLNEIKALADSRYSKEFSHAALWGSASAMLTIEQLEIIKRVVSS